MHPSGRLSVTRLIVVDGCRQMFRAPVLSSITYEGCGVKSLGRNHHSLWIFN